VKKDIDPLDETGYEHIPDYHHLHRHREKMVAKRP
jgi:hypothetical protein